MQQVSLAAVVGFACLLGNFGYGQCVRHHGDDNPGLRDGQQQASVLDASSLLQTHVQIPEHEASVRDASSLLQTQVQFPEREVPSSLAHLAPDDRLQMMVNLAMGDVRSPKKDPWIYAPMDNPVFGSRHDDSTIWSKYFEEWDRVKHEERDESARTEETKYIVTLQQDGDDIGIVFQKIPCEDDPNMFHLKTIFDTYLKRDDDGTITAMETGCLDCNRTRFSIADHPTLPDMGKCIVPAQVPDLCIGVKNAYGEVANVRPLASKPSSAYKVAMMDDYVTLRSQWGWVTVGVHPNKTLEWRHQMETAFPYEMQQEVWETAHGEPDKQFFLAWKGGLVTGLVIGGLIFLAVYNINFWLRSSAVSPPARLPFFDCVRFALETLVVHQHMGMLSLQANTIAMFFSVFRMPAFMFIAGVFGSSMKYESVSKVLCCTWGTATLMYLIKMSEDFVVDGPEEAVKAVTPFIDYSFEVGEVWFIMALAYYRLVITPIFHAARSYRMRPIMVFIIVKSFNFLLMTWAGHWDVPIYGPYIWTNTLAFTPFFSLGLLFTPKEWDELFRRRSLQAASALYMTVWYLMILVKPFLNWNKAYCLPQMQTNGGCVSHFDPATLAPGATIERFLMDWLFFVMRAGMTVSVVAVLYALCMFVQPRVPLAIEWTAGWGSRTLFTYVLHLHFVVAIVGIGRLPSVITEVGWYGKLGISLVAPWLINILLASKGTEHLFKWFLMPFWMKDFCERNILVSRTKTAGPEEGAKGSEGQKPAPEEMLPVAEKQEEAALKEVPTKEARPKEEEVQPQGGKAEQLQL